MSDSRSGLLPRRLALVPIAVVLAIRCAVLSGQPLGILHVPDAIVVAFGIGAVIVLVGILRFKPWTSTVYAIVAVATGAPYLAYVAWVFSAVPSFSGVVVATMADLTLVPYLVAMTFGRVRSLEETPAP